MKKLQKDFTTTEQSKRLLDLGVPADSANCCYPETHLGERVKTADYVHVLGDGERILGDKAIPCWSVGRLMEIFEICDITPLGTENNMCSIPSIKRMSYMEYMIKCFTKAIEMRILDFSKLKE